MLTKVLGVDIQAVLMTMLALVGLYLVLTRASALNAVIRSIATGTNDSFFILQGRTPPGYVG